MRTIESETPILPWLVAETVLERRGITPTDEICTRYEERANMIFNSSESFRERVTAKGNQGRDYLYLIFNHWTDAKLYDPNVAQRFNS